MGKIITNKEIKKLDDLIQYCEEEEIKILYINLRKTFNRLYAEVAEKQKETKINMEIETKYFKLKDKYNKLEDDYKKLKEKSLDTINENILLHKEIFLLQNDK